jgi:hypothetical protein
LNKTPVAISISQDKEKLAAKKNQQYSKPPGVIPLTCPFIVDNQPCQKLTSCFFQHAKIDPPRNASYTLFQSASSSEQRQRRAASNVSVEQRASSVLSSSE